MATSNPWTGDFNVRGASLTFTNAAEFSRTYYFCLFDFPSSFQSEMNVSFDSVTEIPYPGGMDYSETTQYSALNRTLVYYTNSQNVSLYYYCIKDTIGAFDPTCWEEAGANSYQLNYVWQDMGNGWPGGNEGDTTVSYPMGLFTTSMASNYDESNGPIVSLGLRCSEGSSYVRTGNPSAKRPPVINLPLTKNTGGQSGVPVYVIFNSATDGSTKIYINVCVNVYTSGTQNNIGFSGPDVNNVYSGTIGSGPNLHHRFAAGLIKYDTTFPPLGGITINGEPNPPFTFPNPISSNPFNYSF